MTSVSTTPTTTHPSLIPTYKQLTPGQKKMITRVVNQADITVFNQLSERLKLAVYNCALKNITLNSKSAPQLCSFLELTEFSDVFKDKVVEIFKENSPRARDFADRIRICLGKLFNITNSPVKTALTEALEIYDKLHPQQCDDSANNQASLEPETTELTSATNHSTTSVVGTTEQNVATTEDTASTASTSCAVAKPKAGPTNHSVELFHVGLSPNAKIDYRALNALNLQISLQRQFHAIPVAFRTREAFDAWQLIDFDWCPGANRYSINESDKKKVIECAEIARKAIQEITDPEDYKLLFLMTATSWRRANNLMYSISHLPCSHWNVDFIARNRFKLFEDSELAKHSGDLPFVFAFMKAQHAKNRSFMLNSRQSLFDLFPKFETFARDTLQRQVPIIVTWNPYGLFNGRDLLDNVRSTWSTHYCPFNLNPNAGTGVKKYINITFESEEGANAGNLLLSGNFQGLQKMLPLLSLNDYNLIVVLAAVSHRYFSDSTEFTHIELEMAREKLDKLKADKEQGQHEYYKNLNRDLDAEIEYYETDYLPMLETRQKHVSGMTSELEQLFSDPQKSFYSGDAISFRQSYVLEAILNFKSDFGKRNVFNQSILDWATNN